jgi:putative acyl-CoA dehydrogenase
VTAVGKYWICKRAPAMINEAAECMGGAGYVEDSILPRLYRERRSTRRGKARQRAVPRRAARTVERAGCAGRVFNELGDGHGDKRLAAHINSCRRRSRTPATFSTARGN